MMLCKDLCMLLPYLHGYTEFKFGNAAFLKFSQVMPVLATHMGFAYLIETADAMLCTTFHFVRRLRG